MNALLRYSDKRYTPKYFGQWMGERRPLAQHYYNAIKSNSGFKRINRIQDLLPGDLIILLAGQDTKPVQLEGEDGHLMLVASTPEKIKPILPLESKGKKGDELNEQWAVWVIDQAKWGHGAKDLRNKSGEIGRSYEGLGKGKFRIYSDKGGQILGFTWSVSANSAYRVQGLEHDPKAYQIIMGRLNPEFN